MLKLINVSKFYHQNNTVAQGLRKVDLEFRIGEFVAVTGESGSGKSTLLNVISGLDSYEDGEMYINGEETSYFSVSDWEEYRRQYIGFVFQNYNIIDSYTVLQNVEMALIVQGYNKKERRERALELIKRVGLESHKNQKASKLSGGQKQRTVIARALAKDCPVIVADEPTGNLDSDTGKKILELLYEISKDKLVIVVTHNYDEIKDYATRKIRLFDGEVAEDKKIKKAVKSEDKAEQLNAYNMNIKDLLNVAFKNVFSVPKKTIFSIVVMIFMMAAFVFAYGARLEQQNATLFPFSSYFNNLSDGRVIVTKYDNTAFIQDELDDFEDIRYVRDIVEYDISLDLLLAGTIQTNYGLDTVNYIIFNSEELDLLDDIVEGRLPEAKNEIVLYDSAGFSVGDTIELSLAKNLRWDMGGYDLGNTIDFEVVGLVAESTVSSFYSGAYLYKEMIDDLAAEAISTYTQISLFINDLELNLWVGYELDPDLDDNTIKAYYNFSKELELCDPELEECDFDLINSTFDFSLSATTKFETTTLDTDITYEEELVSSDNYTIKVSQDIYDALFAENIYQPSLVVYDGFEASYVMNELERLGYNSFYPSGVTNEFDEGFIVLQNLGMFFTLAFTLFVTYFAGYFVLKNVVASKKKDYLVYRSIGMSKSALNRVSIFELLIQMLIGFSILMIGLAVNERYDTFIPRYLRFFDTLNYIFLLILISALVLLLGRRFNKRIFNKSVISSLKAE